MLEKNKNIIKSLQQDILKWQGSVPIALQKTKKINLGGLEKAFPQETFPNWGIHEMLCPSMESLAATKGLIAGLLSTIMQEQGVIAWIGPKNRLFAPALKHFGLLPHHIVFIETCYERNILWATEEALNCSAFAGVMVEAQELSFAQSRRLQLAAESNGTTCFVLRNNLNKTKNNNCTARWQITPLPSKLEAGLPGVGHPRWQVELLKVRNGNTGTWQLGWQHGKFINLSYQNALAAERLKVV